MNVLRRRISDLEPLYVLGLLPLEDLPDWASSLLENGIDTEHVLQLAISCRTEPDRLRELFERIMKIEGLGVLSKTEALRRYAAMISADILSGRTSPGDGAHKIWDIVVKAHPVGFHELDAFIYAASEMGDRPNDKAFFDDAVIAEAKRWCSSTNK